MELIYAHWMLLAGTGLLACKIVWIVRAYARPAFADTGIAGIISRAAADRTFTF